MSSREPWSLDLMPPEQPIPAFIRDRHRVRVVEWNWMKAGDYDTSNDWTQTLTATGTQTRTVPSLTLSSPCLNLNSAASGDGAVTVQTLKWIQMPAATQGILFYMAVEFAIPTATTNLDLVFGISSTTPANTFDPATKAVLAAGAGILIRRTASSNLWELFYKTGAGTLQTLGSTTLNMAATSFYRGGFLVLVDIDSSASNSKPLGRVIPFLTQLSNSGQAGGDDLAEMPDSAFFMGKTGFLLDRTNANHADASATQCGIALGSAGAGAGARLFAIRRLIVADNLRR